MDRSCKNCQNFFKTDSEQGECRILPPIIIHSWRTEKGELYWHAGWPSCKATHWCGGYEKRLEIVK